MAERKLRDYSNICLKSKTHQKNRDRCRLDCPSRIYLDPARGFACLDGAMMPVED